MSPETPAEAKISANILPKRAMILREHVGEGEDPNNGETFKLSSSMDRSPIVEFDDYKVSFSWSDLVACAQIMRDSHVRAGGS